MTATKLSSIESTVQKTQIWINEIMAEMDWDNPDRACQALKVVLHALRDRLPLNESANLSAQLPTLVRGMYFENWRPKINPDRQRSFAEFVDHVAQHFAGDHSVDPEWTSRSVMKVLARHVSAGEIADVKSCLPEELRDLWN